MPGAHVSWPNPPQHGEGPFAGLSHLVHKLWNLMAQYQAMKEIRYGPIHLKRSDPCPCVGCAKLARWQERLREAAMHGGFSIGR